ncbi:MAG: hypothetical protein RAP03_19230 [Candidatus Electryonea clarkiae]|nr:hypothetical protein [Candidatus Electryonea clarkiae]
MDFRNISRYYVAGLQKIIFSLITLLGFLALLVIIPTLYALPPPTEDELKSVPGSFSEGLAAVQKWDYYRANLIFHNVENKRFSRKKTFAHKWIEKIERITSEVIIHRIDRFDSWESIALNYFHDSSFAIKLATFNRSSIVVSPVVNQEVRIPIVHVEAHLGFSTFDDANSVSLDTLLIGINRLRTALKIDPEYPELPQYLMRVESIYEQRQTVAMVDSLEKTAELEAARYEFTKAIRLLAKAQEFDLNEKRIGKISRLIQRRRKHLPILFEIGNEKFRSDDLHGALNAWKRVAEVNPNFRDVKERINKVERMLRLLEGIDDTNFPR